MAIFTNGGLVGTRVRVCHKYGEIVRENEDSYTAEIELGGVVQHVLLSKQYVLEELGER